MTFLVGMTVDGGVGGSKLLQGLDVEVGTDGALEDFMNLQTWGTPDMCYGTIVRNTEAHRRGSVYRRLQLCGHALARCGAQHEMLRGRGHAASAIQRDHGQRRLGRVMRTPRTNT